MAQQGTISSRLLRRLFRSGPTIGHLAPDDALDHINGLAARRANEALAIEIKRLMAIHDDHPDHESLLGGGFARGGDLSRDAQDLEYLLTLAAAGSSGQLHGYTAHLLKRTLGHTRGRLAQLDAETVEHGIERDRLSRLTSWENGASNIISARTRAQMRNRIGGESDTRAALLGGELQRCACAGDAHRLARFGDLIEREVAAGRLPDAVILVHSALSSQLRASVASSGVRGTRPA